MADEQMPLKVHRIQTEDVNRDGVLALLDQAFEAYTVNLSLGRWRGKSEPSLTIEVTGTTYEAVSKVAEDIRSMNSQEAVLVSEYEPSKVNFLFRPILAACLGGLVVYGAMLYQGAAIHKVEKQKYNETMIFPQEMPPPMKLDNVDTQSLVEELKKRLSAMGRSERQRILRQLKSLPPPPPLDPEPWKH
jgi:hypothetical protein